MKQIVLWLIKKLLEWVPEYELTKRIYLPDPEDIFEIKKVLLPPEGYHLHKNPKRQKKEGK